MQSIGFSAHFMQNATTLATEVNKTENEWDGTRATGFGNLSLVLCTYVRREEGRKTVGKFQGETTYLADYRQWEVQPREKVGADNTYRPSSAQFEGISNY